MPATRASIDISQLLTGTDCDVANEYNSMLDAANDLERKHRSIMEQAQKLKSIVQAKQAEIEQTTARHQAKLADHIPRRKLSERLQGLRQKLKTSRREADRLREDLRHLHNDSAANQAELKSTKTALRAALDVDMAGGLKPQQRSCTTQDGSYRLLSKSCRLSGTYVVTWSMQSESWISRPVWIVRYVMTI